MIKRGLILLIILLFSYSALASEGVRKITVTGKSEIVLEAQYAVINININIIKDEMSASHSELIRIIDDLSTKLKVKGLSATDIKKSLILQGQEFAWEMNSRVFKGYYASCSIDLYVNEIKNISGVYRELANYKELTIRNTDFRRRDEFEVRKAELEKAINAAKNKAEHMAHVLGAKIGKVYSIQETRQNEYLSHNNYSNVRSAGEDTGQTGYGNIKISGEVILEFELE